MNDDQLLRYSRQILLPEFGIEGQQRLLASRVLIVGLGGLGSPVALYLAAAGVGELILADDDVVELSNVQRQILHTTERLGLPKVDSAMLQLQALNPEVRLRAWRERVDETTLAQLLTEVDLVIDACDNFATRFAINRACFAAGVALVSGAAIRLEGQVAVFSGQAGGPCYQCLYPPDASDEEARCAENGILAPVVGIIGSMQACEAIKLLTGYGSPLARLLLLDAWGMEWRSIGLQPDPACVVCAAKNR